MEGTSSKKEKKRSSKSSLEELDKMLEEHVDKLLGEEQLSGEDTSKAGGDTEGSEERMDDLMEMMKRMEFEFDRRKRRTWSNFWFNTAVGVTFVFLGIYAARLYTAGQWRSLQDCEGDQPADFCHSCYGPFSGWLWCVRD